MTKRSLRKHKNGASEPLPRFNHYVPKFILQNFALDGKICIFDKHSQREFKLPPYQAMGENDFNNVTLRDAVVSFENRFTYIENKAAPIIKEIVEARSLEFMDQMQTATLHMFVLIQHLRSKMFRINQDHITNEIKRRWPDIQINSTPDMIADDELSKLSALKMTFENLTELTKYLAVKHSYLMIRDCAGEIYVSDSPLVMHNQRQFGPYGNIGIGVPGIEIYLPLSADVVLAYACPSTIKEIEDEQHNSDRAVADFFAKCFMSPTGLTSDNTALLERTKVEIKRARHYHHMMKQRRLAPMTSENLLYLNSLQMSSSHRYIAARTPYFHFARQALRERPLWKTGHRVQVG